MLVHANACLCELVRPDEDLAIRSLVALRKAGAVELVRQKRDEGAQQVAFGARPFVLCGLPIRKLPDGHSGIPGATGGSSSRSSAIPITACPSARTVSFPCGSRPRPSASRAIRPHLYERHSG
jgi:hypothetical protein